MSVKSNIRLLYRMLQIYHNCKLRPKKQTTRIKGTTVRIVAYVNPLKERQNPEFNTLNNMTQPRCLVALTISNYAMMQAKLRETIKRFVTG